MVDPQRGYRSLALPQGDFEGPSRFGSNLGGGRREALQVAAFPGEVVIDLRRVVGVAALLCTLRGLLPAVQHVLRDGPEDHVAKRKVALHG